MSPQQTIAHYRITAKLGEGGMGEVWRATDTKLNRDVAIKILPEAFAHDPDRMARFTREAQVLASLNHPQIAAIYGVEERALVMELVLGPTLAERIAQGPISLEDALPLATQIAEALEYAHERGIVHRDLKPANLKITPEGRVKVLDFGLAKAMASDAPPADAAASPTLTMRATVAGVILGTAAYMSPEQARGQNVDRRADVWAFGVVLYEMVTGRQPFAGATISDTLAAVLKTEPDLTAVPEPLRRIVRLCLERDPRMRLRDIGDARVLLAEAPALELAALAAPPRRPYLWPAAAGALMLALAAALWAPWRQPPPAPETSQFVILPPEKSSFSNRVSSQAISPDGRNVVFGATNAEGNPELWLRRLDTLVARPLIATDGLDPQPFWSPDSRSIAFFSGGKLRRVDVSGGNSQVIADAPFPRGGAWNRAGDIVFSPRRNEPLYRVPAAGGAASLLTRFDQSKEDVGHYWPAFLPDGRHFLFGAFGLGGAKLRVCVASLDSNEVRDFPDMPAPAVYSPPGYLLYVRDSGLMAQAFDATRLSLTGAPILLAERMGTGGLSPVYRGLGFTVSQTGTLLYRSDSASQTHLVWVDRGGRTLDEAAPAGVYTNPVLSPDGKRVAFDRVGEGGFDIWLMDLERRITSRFTRGSSNVPVWSPDGGTVAFAFAHSGKLNIYRRPSNMGGPEEALLQLGASPVVYPSDWSADGRYVAYFRTDPKTQLDIWVMPQFGDRKPFLFAHGDYNESQGQFSPDGNWMAYVSDESGSPQVWVQSFPALTGKWQVSTDGGSEPRWRRDGKELFYVAPNRKMMSVAVKTSATFQADAPRALFDTTLTFAPLRQNYSVATDGQRFLLNVPAGGAAPPMTIVLNWTAGLKK
jgi:serine/threonine protein kinase